MIPQLMGFVLICITLGGHEHEFLHIFLQYWIALKYIFRHILLIISTCNLELFRKLPIPMGNIMWKLEDHSYSSKQAILLQSWHFDICKNSILCIKRILVSRYTECPKKNATILIRNINDVIDWIPLSCVMNDSLSFILSSFSKWGQLCFCQHSWFWNKFQLLQACLREEKWHILKMTLPENKSPRIKTAYPYFMNLVSNYLEKNILSTTAKINGIQSRMSLK